MSTPKWCSTSQWCIPPPCFYSTYMFLLFPQPENRETRHKTASRGSAWNRVPPHAVICVVLREVSASEGTIPRCFWEPCLSRNKSCTVKHQAAPNSSEVLDLGLNRHTEFSVLVNCAVSGPRWPQLWASVQWGTGDVGHEPGTAGISQPINTGRCPGDLSDVKGACGYLLIQMWKPRQMTEDVRAASLTPVQNI